MKKITLLICLVSFNLVQGQNTSGVLISEDINNTIEESAILEIRSDDKGVKFPSISLSSSLSDASMILNGPIDGLLIYNNGTQQNKGFYFWDASTSFWIPISESSSSTPSNCTEDVWHVIGNGGFLSDGVTPVPNFNNGFQNILWTSLSMNNITKLSIRKTCNGFVHISGYIFSPARPSIIHGPFSIINLPLGYYPQTDIAKKLISNSSLTDKQEFVFIESNVLKMYTPVDVSYSATWVYINFSYKAL